jgi:predicted small lipoprotein YifL
MLPRRRRLLRMALATGLLATAACGSKGPPLAPYARVPATVTAVAVQRIGDDVFVSFPVPDANVDGQKPADIASLEVYAITAISPPETEAQRKLATLVATIPVRPIMPDLPPPPPGVEVPAVVLPPGIDRALPAVAKETLTAEARLEVVLPPKPGFKEVIPPVDEEPVIGPLVAPSPTLQPRRFYFVIGITPRGRKSLPSVPVPVPLESASSAPGAPEFAVTETGMTVTWAPSPDARSGAFLLPPPLVAPPVVAANATPATVPPPKPPPPVLVAKSLGFQSEATTYHLFEVLPPAEPDNPFAVELPVGITPAPLLVTSHVIPGVTFGEERCFFVRPVDRVAGAVVMGPASPQTCVTPADTFPPAAPKSLAAIAGEGVISLIWEPNIEPDLAGYLVLRGEAPGDTLRAITPEPVTATAYRDTTARTGTRYVYVVVAVDRATPQNVSAQSARVEETAR